MPFARGPKPQNVAHTYRMQEFDGILLHSRRPKAEQPGDREVITEIMATVNVGIEEGWLPTTHTSLSILTTLIARINHGNSTFPMGCIAVPQYLRLKAKLLPQIDAAFQSADGST